jgi:hypothetical protein
LLSRHAASSRPTSDQRQASFTERLPIILVFWLSILFASFGSFAPRNATVMAAFSVCALLVAGAIFSILELDRPFQGLMQISSKPFSKVLEH